MHERGEQAGRVARRHGIAWFGMGDRSSYGLRQLEGVAAHAVSRCIPLVSWRTS